MCGARGHRNGKTRTTTTLRLTGPLKFHSFWPRTAWQWSPIPHTHPIWPPVTFSSSPIWSFGWRVEDSTPLKRFKRNRRGYLTQFQKGTSRDASKHGRNAGTAVFVQKVQNVRCKRPQKWQNQKLIIHHNNAPAHRSFKVSQFLAKNSMTVVPHPPYSHDLAPCDFFLFPQAEASDEGSKIRHHWRDSRGIAAGTWHNSKNGLPGMLPSMAETLGPQYSCKRGVLWRWWRNLTSKVSKLLFTSTVLELLDTSLYLPS